MPDYFTLTEFRALPDMANATTYPDARVEASAAYFTSVVEREVGAPFIPRSVTETLDGTGASTLVLSTIHVRSLTSVTVGGVAVTVGDLTAEYGILRYLNGGTSWAGGVQNVTVTYMAGEFAVCPPDIKEPVMWATRDRLLNQATSAGVDARKTSVQTEFGTTNYVLPGERRPTGYPELDAAIAGRQRTTPTYGFA